MPNLETLLPKLKRVDGTSLDEADMAKLREFFAQFVNESEAELERKRKIMRNRVNIPRNEEDEFREDQYGATRLYPGVVLSWPNPQLDQAKHDILTAIIQERTRAKLAPAAPAPSPFLTEFDLLLLKLRPTRIDGAPLDDSDIAKLRGYYEEMRGKPREQIHAICENQIARADLQAAWATHKMQTIAEYPSHLNRAPPLKVDWPDAHLDTAKLAILGTLVAGNSRPPSPERTQSPLAQAAPVPTPPATQSRLWTRYVAFTGGTGRALIWPLGLCGGILTLLRVFGAI